MASALLSLMSQGWNQTERQVNAQINSIMILNYAVGHAINTQGIGLENNEGVREGIDTTLERGQ